jgi:hypothetical protein
LSPAYKEAYPVGTDVRIAQRQKLEEFASHWRFHHPLTEEQIRYAGQVVRVQNVGYYHGGDVLYVLDGIPGTWHECCLEAVVKGG